MDRFKFRVWDIRRKLYITNGTIDMRNGIFATLGFEEAKKFIPEQCTGLKDKNGKLIYEGDILFVKVFDWKTGKIETYWSVEYKDYANKSGFMVYGKNRRFHKPLTKSAIFNSEAVIIGNIHENPELLEEK